MKKIILIALSVMLFIGCDDATKEEAPTPKATTETISDAKKAVEEIKEKAVESTKEVKKVITPAVKETTPKVVESTKEIKKEATKVVNSVVEDTNKTLSSTTEKNATVDASTLKYGATLFKKCATCHGKDGKKSAFEKSAIIAGQNAETIIKSLTDYQAGSRDISGMGKLMSGQIRGVSAEDIKALADYISTL